MTSVIMWFSVKGKTLQCSFSTPFSKTWRDEIGQRFGIHYADGGLTARSREVSKPRDSGLDYSNRSKT